MAPIAVSVLALRSPALWARAAKLSEDVSAPDLACTGKSVSSKAFLLTMIGSIWAGFVQKERQTWMDWMGLACSAMASFSDIALALFDVVIDL